MIRTSDNRLPEIHGDEDQLLRSPLGCRFHLRHGGHERVVVKHSDGNQGPTPDLPGLYQHGY